MGLQETRFIVLKGTGAIAGFLKLEQPSVVATGKATIDFNRSRRFI
jgi:hypothetical protein